MKKKIVSLLLAATMIMSVCLSGCGNEKQEESKTPESSKVESSAGESEATSTEEKPQLEEKTIQIWIGGPGKQKDSDEVWEEFNKRLQEYVPNTTVEFTVLTTAEYGTQFEQMLAAGEEVDLAWIANWVTGSTSTNIDDGNLMPLNDLVAEYGQGIVEAMGQNVIDAHLYKDGELYYLPSWQGLTTDKKGIFVIKEIADLAGATWYEDTQAIVTEWWNHDPSAENLQKVYDQFDKYFAAAKDAGKLCAGTVGSKFMGWNYSQNYAKGSEWVGPLRHDDTFTVVDTAQQDHYKTYIKNQAEFYKKGYIRSDIASVDTSQFSFIKNGEYTDNTCILYVDNFLTQSKLESMQKDAGVELYGIEIEEKGYLGLGDATAMAVPYCADEPERAMMVLDVIYSVPEMYQLLIYGIEGKHYTDNGDGTVTTSYGAEGTADADYGLWRWTIGTCKNSLVTQADTAGYYDELAENDKVSPANIWATWSFDGTGTEDICAALKALRLEYEPIFSGGYTGDDWEATYDKFIKARKDAGVDKLIEEVQKQMSAYVKETGLTSW